MKTVNDVDLTISIAPSCRATCWENIEIRWSELLERFSRPVRTGETAAEYQKMTSAEKLARKDVGGFVGGELKNGSRHNENVVSRGLICLDADDADPELWNDLEKLDYAWALYTTHSYREDCPRCRVVIPLSAPVSLDRYGAISRYIAGSLKISRFDRCTHEPARMMFWPSASEDGSYDFRFGDHPALDPEAFLTERPDWRDVSALPGVVREKKGEKPVQTGSRHMTDPREKKDIVGAFCRAHDIPDVLTNLLKDVYLPTDQPNRFTLAGRESEKGLVVYDGGLFARSFHATDPAGGDLRNAFDLVRMHLFPPNAEKGVDDKKSFRLMADLASRDAATKVELVKYTRSAEPSGSGSADPADPDGWMAELEIEPRTGRVLNTEQNIEIILAHDPDLRGLVHNEFSGFAELRDDIAPLPWKHPFRALRDQDLSQLKSYLEKRYAHFSQDNFMVALTKVTDDRRYHPVREYLEKLPPWDGVERLDRLLIDCLGAEDNEYTRAVTRKTFVAAVRRIFQPGIKFDSMLVLVGKQGSGKSTLIAKMAGEWFSDSLSWSDTKDKSAAEKLQGYWILEISELAGMRFTEVESMRAFITRTKDIFRPAYGRTLSEHPRQCIFIGTSNAEDGFLRDEAGNRRFWPVLCAEKGGRDSWSLTREEVDLLWAEAVCREKQGESLVLEGAAADHAARVQNENLQYDERTGAVQDFLELEIPADWRRMTLEERREYVSGQFFIRQQKSNTAKIRRKQVSVAEIWTECFEQPIVKLGYPENRSIQLILQRLGWVKADKKRRDTTGQVRICYLSPEAAAEERNAGDFAKRLIPVPTPDDCPF